MNIGILPFRKEKRVDGINRLTQGLFKEIIEIDYENQYSFLGYGRFLDVDIPEKKIIADSWNILNLNSRVIQDKYDIVHSMYYCYHVNSNIPCAKILTICDLCPWGVKIYGDNWDKSAKWMDKIIAISDYTKCDIVDKLNVNPDKIEVIYPGMFSVGTEYCEDNISERIKEITQKPYIMTVSTMREYKNMVGLVKAFILYKNHHKDSDLNLLLVGKEFKSCNVKEQLVELCKDRRDIITTGYVSDEELVYLYKNCIATGFVSFYEGFGLPVLESLSFGKTVVCSNQTSLPEVGGDAVEYCNPYEVESIEYAIEKVVLNESYRRELEKKALLQASKFSYRRAAQETLEVYKLFS
ncbi:MAG: glycosyltransferase family 4 protein [Lachnospira sp.]